jgi:hypothetical protein
MKHIGYEELYTDFNYMKKEDNLCRGMAINTYKDYMRLNIYNLNLMNNNEINFEGEEISFCFDYKKTIKTYGCFNEYPSINSKKQKEFNDILDLLISSSHLKVETYLGTYVIYDISCFNEYPAKNWEEIEEKMERLPKERFKKKIDNF